MFEILDNRAILNIYGPDTIKFLQNFTTNDLVNKQYSYNYLLNNQGRYLFDFFIFKANNENLYLDCDVNSADNLIKRLNLYKLRANTTIENVTSKYKIIYTPLKDNNTFQNFIYNQPDSRFSKLGQRILIARAEIINPELSIPGLYLRDKYEYAIIDGAIDLEPEKSIPIEFGAEELNAISYDKGCYVGQEVISRAKHQGVVRKKIYQLKFGTTIADDLKSSTITDEKGNKLGKICSNYQNLAIAQLKEEKFLELAEKLAIVNNDKAEIIVPPWQ